MPRAPREGLFGSRQWKLADPNKVEFAAQLRRDGKGVRPN